MMIARAWVLTATLALASTTAGAQRPIVPFATGAVVEHRVTTSGEVERVSGGVWGGGVTLTMTDWVGVRGRLAGGNLSARTPDAEGRSLSEGELTVILTPDRWLSLDVGTTIRAMETPLVRQKWTELRAGSEVGFDLVDGLLRGTVRLSIVPWMSVSGHPSPDLAIGAGTGLQYTAGRMLANLDYSLDRYDFPAGSSARRLEQRSTLTARIGWRLR